MKGIILERSDARLVDVSHDFPRGDVRAAAFWLRQILPYFPPAVHLVVVDPGVGTDRNALVIRAGNHALVGPDNGVLCPVARRLSSSADRSQNDAAFDREFDAYVIECTDPASNTFHGRDVFAPMAASVHERGIGELESLESLSPATAVVDLEFPEAEISEREAVGEVLVVDDFGNVITNVSGAFLENASTVVANGQQVVVGETFAAVETGERLATVGSHGLVELDVNGGRGDRAFDLEPGSTVTLEREG